MDATLKAGLQAPVVRIFASVQVDLWNGDTIRLLNGDAVIDIGSAAFVGEDATYGKLDSLDNVSDGNDGSAPQLKVTLLARDNDAVDALIDARAQGSHVVVSQGVQDGAGLCVGIPEPIFVGEIDVPTFIPTADQLAIEVACNSVWDRLFDRDEGARLSNSFWTTVFPGDTGCEDEVSLIKPIFWGEASVDPADPSGTGLVARVVLAAMQRANKA